MGDLVALPFELGAIIREIKGKSWEPCAEAALLSLAAKQFGVDRLEQVIDPDFIRQRKKEEMIAEWRQRAARPGEFAVMSARYPTERMDIESSKFVDAVMRFLGPDIRNRDVVEIGCGNGRITQRLVSEVSSLTAVDLSEDMLTKNRLRLGEVNREKLHYVCAFAQDYHPSKKHEIAICSLVLIHNTDAQFFSDLVTSLRACADVIFLFEHVDPGSISSEQTRIRTEEELLEAFSDYTIDKRESYQLFSDRLVFMKLVRTRTNRAEATI
jgi:SAM-dependent methyltransferase